MLPAVLGGREGGHMTFPHGAPSQPSKSRLLGRPRQGHMIHKVGEEKGEAPHPGGSFLLKYQQLCTTAGLKF